MGLPLDTDIGRHSSTPHLEGEPAFSSNYGQSTSFTHHATVHMEVGDQHLGAKELSNTDDSQGILSISYYCIYHLQSLI